MLFSIWNFIWLIPLFILIGLTVYSYFFEQFDSFYGFLLMSISALFLIFIPIYMSIHPIKYEESINYKNMVKTEDRILFEFYDGTYKIVTDIKYFTADTILVKKIYKVNTYNDTSYSYDIYLEGEQ